MYSAAASSTITMPLISFRIFKISARSTTCSTDPTVVFSVWGDLIPIPWSATRTNIKNDKLVLNLNKDKLDKAPSFKDDNWSEFFSPGYQKDVHAYYGETGRMHQKQIGNTPNSQPPAKSPQNSQGQVTPKSQSE